MKNKDIHVFVITFNRLKYLKRTIAWLEHAGFEKIHIVDNASTYPPLVDYLDHSKHTVHRLKKNYGHLVVWECGEFDDILQNEYYIVTDFDILPISECPTNVTEHFFDILNRYKRYTKVGFSLKINDLPDHYAYKEEVVAWEGQFWKKEMEEGVYKAIVDTTFALYRPGIYPSTRKWWRSLRTGYPYTARHLPWYDDTSVRDEEDLYYQKYIKNRSSYWSVTDIALLKNYHQELADELSEIYDSVQWRLLQYVYKAIYFVTRSKYILRKIGKKEIEDISAVHDVIEVRKHNRALFDEIAFIRNSVGWEVLRILSRNDK